MSLQDVSRSSFVEHQREVFGFTRLNYRLKYKRLFDLGLTIAAMPILVPVIFTLAVLVSLDGGNPFYVQKRVGLYGRVFRLVKLRTMVVNADQVLTKQIRENPKIAEEWHTNQKIENDTRITRIGRLLRATSLDELPQFWNVLRGDMSIVGPRPMIVAQRRLYEGSAYFQLKPGITGNWQVSCRSESSFAQRADYDLAYRENYSFLIDLQIVLKTVLVVLRCTGR